MPIDPLSPRRARNAGGLTSRCEMRICSKLQHCRQGHGPRGRSRHEAIRLYQLGIVARELDPVLGSRSGQNLDTFAWNGWVPGLSYDPLESVVFHLSRLDPGEQLECSRLSAVGDMCQSSQCRRVNGTSCSPGMPLPVLRPLKQSSPGIWSSCLVSQG